MGRTTDKADDFIDYMLDATVNRNQFHSGGYVRNINNFIPHDLRYIRSMGSGKSTYRSLHEHDVATADYARLSGISYEDAAEKVKAFAEIAKKTGKPIVMKHQMPKKPPPYPTTTRIQFDKTGRVL